MEGVVVYRGELIISHLFFVDDSLIFCKASMNDCNSLQHVLKVYEDASGQQLIKAKTSLFVNTNTNREIQEEIKTRFGAQIIRQHEKYLGLPTLISRNKKYFQCSEGKVGKKLVGWKEKLMSKASKEILIKVVA